MTDSKDNEKKRKKALVLILLFASLAGVGGGALLWKQLAGNNSEQLADKAGLKKLLEKYVDAGQFSESFSLLNQALQQNPDDAELQQELERILARKQEYDRNQMVSAQDNDQRDLVDNLIKQNTALQNRTNDLWQQLENFKSEQQGQQNQEEQRKREAEELVRQGQDVLKDSQSQDSSPDEDAITAAQDAKNKALQALELNSNFPSARKLLEAAEAALRKNESQEQQKEREDTANEIEQMHKALVKARQKGDDPAIEKLVDKLLEKDSLDSEANVAKAKQIEKQIGQKNGKQRSKSSEVKKALQEAESAYRKALAKKPEQPEALAGLAQNLDNQNRLGEAVEAYDKALEKVEDPFDSELNYLRGIALYRTKRFQEAVDSFNEYIDSGGQNLRAFYALGLSYKQLLRSRDSRKAFETAIAKGLEHAATYWELSKLELEQSNINEALEHVEAALALKAGDSRYLQTKGAILFDLKRYEEAADTYKLADNVSRGQTERGQVNYNMGLSYYNSAQFTKAETAFDKAVDLDSKRPEYILGLADAQIASGKKEEAQKTLAFAADQFPNNVDFLLTQGNIYLKAKAYDDALKIFQKAYEHNPKDRKIINNLGLAYMNTERFDQSRIFFRKAIEEDPSNSNLWFNLALVDVATEHHDDAIGSLEKTLTFDSKMIEAYYLLIKEYLSANQRDKARITLERLRRADPKYSKIIELEKLLNM